MSNNHNIDELLKESFDNFSPDAPDVWQAVQQGVQAAQASSAASSGMVGASVQGVSLAVKIVAGIAIAAAAVTGYIVFNKPVQQDTPKPADTVVNEITTTQPQESEKPAAATIKEEKIESTPATNNIAKKIQPEFVSKSPEPVDQAKVAEKPIVERSREVVAPQPATKVDIVASTPSRNENVSKVESTSATKLLKNDTEKPAAPKQTKSQVLPYNPNAEDGEEYEKPNIPGSISPNNDGLNDRFEINIENETLYALRILNDKGETVFESKNKEQMWDGKHYKTGMPCSAGKYIYIFNYQYKGSEKVHEKSGLVELFLKEY